MKRALATCALLLAGCPADPPDAVDAGTDAGLDASAPAWRAVAEKLDGALLAVWGPSPNDVWAVGGALGNGAAPTVVRWNGVGVTPVPTTGTRCGSTMRGGRARAAGGIAGSSGVAGMSPPAVRAWP